MYPSLHGFGANEDEGSPDDTSSNVVEDDLLLKGNQYQSLLLQLVHPQVRQDLLAGRITSVMASQGDPTVGTAEEALEGLDWLRMKLIPPVWATDVQRKLGSNEALSTLRKLVQKSPEVLTLGNAISNSKQHSYRAWADLLDGLGSSDYWSKEPASRLSMRYLTVPERFLGNPVAQEEINEKLPKEDPGEGCSHAVQPALSDVKLEKIIRSPSSSNMKTVYQQRTITPIRDTICISDSSLEESGDELSIAEEPTRSGGHHSVRKEIARPPMFEMNGWQPLSQFLQAFERYFNAKYVGNERDCTMHLAEFLPDKMREYYHILGGGKLKFSKMKQELLSWYRTQERLGARHWRAKLMSETMNEEESLKVYALRLKDIATKAYPNDEANRIRELRHRYLETVPADFARHLQITQDASRVAGYGSKLGWTDILRLAEKEDERQRKRNQAVVKPKEKVPSKIWFNRDETKALHGGAGESLASCNVCHPSPAAETHLADSQVNTREQTPGNSSQQDRGHQSQRTRVFSGRGGRSQRSSQQTESQRGRNFIPCNWCGRSGHKEDNCWERQGKCTGCGEAGHSINDCTRHKERYPGGDPVCPICRGAHLGKACKLVTGN